MGKLILGLIFAAIGLLTLIIGAAAKGEQPRAASGLLRTVAMALLTLGGAFAVFSTVVVIGPGTVGVRHAFGHVDPEPLLPGINFVTPWSNVERFSTREEQFPEHGDAVEEIAALSSEQMGMTVDVAIRWQIDPQDAPRIFREIGGHSQIAQVVQNAIRNGVRDGMVQFTINDIAQRNRIAAVMESEVDSALVTRPHGADQPFRIARVTAFFLRDLQPPAQVVAAINAKIAQEQQIQTERHRVEVARLQAEQQRVLNQTLTPEALAKQYLEVLHDLRTSNNMVLFIPTEGGMPMLDIGALRRNLQSGR
ncbi:MAG TPA: SPFH domain-containing protein [Gemmatimonadales bacterium]|nr:SPFH domain-containing protein [Gemmatimonadales bacterium]